MKQQIAVGEVAAVPAFSGYAGVGREDVTPPVGIRIRNWGPAETDVSAGCHRPLTVTVVALRGTADAPPLVLVAVDATWWRRVDDEARFRAAVLDGLGLDPARLLVALSHTHAGPVLCTTDSDLPGGELVPGYLDQLAQSTIAAGRDALARIEPATLQWATGHCALAAERELDLDGRPVVGFNPRGQADDTVLVGRLSGASGPLATIVNYACHPTTLAWQNRLVSPDYVGAMRELVEQQTGAPCAFLQGASGELAPRDQYTGDIEVADRHGRTLGHAVLSALSGLPPPGTALTLTGVVESGAPLAVWEPLAATGDVTLAARQGEVELALRELPPLTELEVEWAGVDERSRSERLRRARNLRDGYVDGPTVRHPVWAWRLGDALVVAHPGEAYSLLQTRLRTHFPDRPVVVCNLTNGPGFVYLPTVEAYERGAYQAWQTAVCPGSLERLEQHCVALLTDLLQEAP
ncbi:MAG: hypothetical protein GEU96_19960 [Propionibacteriales bacterium]|nr:hypothetical protein [Propionibacteriales bacterium]